MELHIRNVLLSNMPIILISADGPNNNLVDFDDMHDIVVDVMFESTDPRSKAIGDILEKKMLIINRLALNRLNDREEDESEEHAGIRITAAVNVIRQMNVRTGIIISHHSVFNSWDRRAMKDNWNVIPIC
jgi:hypothetical protein